MLEKDRILTVLITSVLIVRKLANTIYNSRAIINTYF